MTEKLIPSNCDKSTTGLLGNPGLVSHWHRELIANWVDEMREKGYDKAPPVKKELDKMEEHYHTRPISVGNAIAKSAAGGDFGQAVEAMAPLSLTDKMEAGCTAKEQLEVQQRKQGDLPAIELFSTQSDPDYLASIKLSTRVSTNIEIR